jgi:hypothetical protein
VRCKENADDYLNWPFPLILATGDGSCSDPIKALQLRLLTLLPGPSEVCLGIIPIELVECPYSAVIYTLVESIDVPQHCIEEYPSTFAHPLLMPCEKAILSGGATRHHSKNCADDLLLKAPS